MEQALAEIKAVPNLAGRRDGTFEHGSGTRASNMCRGAGYDMARPKIQMTVH
jgi:hypothetical protein